MKILVISSKETWAAKRLAEEAEKAKIILVFATADKVSAINPKDFNVLYIRNPFIKGSPKCLPNIIRLAKKFRAAGKKIVDSAAADGYLAEGKWSDYQKLKKAGLPIPNTYIVHGRELCKYEFPLVLKWNYGLKAKNVFLAGDEDQLKKMLPLHPCKEWLVQEFIKADYEYKVITVGYKALPVVSRFKVQGSRFKIDFLHHKIIKKSAIPKAVKLAEKASKLLGRELSKVDILQKGKNLYILEVNRFPGLEWFEKLTKVNATKAFLRYLQK